MGTEARLRARLLHAADPAHARIALAGTLLGAPVDVGMVIRAMRGRRGVTQAELARTIGVSQAAVAHWESGDSAPSGETVHRIGYALGATVEETVALACATGGSSGRLPEKAPEENPVDFYIYHLPHCLKEVVSLGFEAEMWPRAARDSRWDPWLCNTIGERAVGLFGEGRLGEAEEAARRALRIAPTPQSREKATVAFSALLQIATHNEADPAVLCERIAAWAARLPDGMGKGWMLWEQALRLADMGRVDEAIELTERMAEQYAVKHPSADDFLVETRASGLIYVEIQAGRPEQAEALLPALKFYEKEMVPRFRVKIAHLRGEPADEATMTAMRAWEAATGRDRRWYNQQKMAKIEREQARLAYSARPS